VGAETICTSVPGEVQSRSEAVASSRKRGKSMARRCQSGTVVLIGDVWYGRYRVDVLGQEARVRRAVPLGSKREGMSKQMAKSKLLHLLEEQGVNSADVFTEVVQPGPTFADQAAWWSTNKLALCAPSYQETRGVYLSTHLLPYFGAMPVVAIGEQTAQEFIADLTSRRHLAPATIASILSTLKSILGVRVTRDWQLRLPPSMGEEPRFFTPGEMLRIVDEATGKWKPFFALLGEAGVRFGEAAALRVEDVDVDAGTVTVRRSIYRGRDVPTKSRAGFRVINISAGLVQRLRDHLSGKVSGRVFETRTGRPLAKDATRHALHRILDRLEIPRGGLHSFRHGRVSMLQAAGVAPDLIRSWVGHSNSRITSRYTHFSADFKREVAERVGLFPTVGLSGLSSPVVSDNVSAV
jgi:integrase